MARFESLDLNLLRTFDVIYTERSLTRASKILNVSQPAVSNALHRLRESLGDPLFVRERRGMMPTSFADSFAPAVHRALESIRDGLSTRETFLPESSRRSFRVSMNDPAEALFLLPLVERCAREAPHVELLCNFISRHEIGNEMSAGALDLAIDVPITVADDRMHHANLTQESYACLLRPGHPLAGERLMMEDYLSLSHIHVSARRHGLGHIDRVLAELGLHRRIKARIRNPGVAAEIVRRTNLVMTVPERFAAYYELAALSLPFEVPALDWRLYWPTRLDGDSGNLWLRRQILEIASIHAGTAPAPPGEKERADA